MQVVGNGKLFLVDFLFVDFPFFVEFYVCSLLLLSVKKPLIQHPRESDIYDISPQNIFIVLRTLNKPRSWFNTLEECMRHPHIPRTFLSKQQKQNSFSFFFA